MLNPETFTCCLGCWFLWHRSYINEVILNEWKAAGIDDTLKLGSRSLRNINPFHDIDPFIVENAIPVEENLDAVYQLDEEKLPHQKETDGHGVYKEDIWEPKDRPRNAFRAFNDFHDEPSKVDNWKIYINLFIFLYFFPYWKISYSRKLISRNFSDFSIRERLSVMSFLASETFYNESFSG